MWPARRDDSRERPLSIAGLSVYCVTKMSVPTVGASQRPMQKPL